MFVVLTLVSGVIVVLDKFYLRARRQPAANGLVEPPIVVEYSLAFFPILLVILVLRSFLYEPYRIPSGSMVPTLLIGDFVFVSKFSYGLRLPVSNTLIMETGHPQRGEVIVFRKPGEPNINFIKRVVGVPGDKIEYANHRLTINGEVMEFRRDGEYRDDENLGILFRETLGTKEHDVLVQSTRPASFSRVVPQGCYFMMGDNRDRSHDSRFSDIGCIPEENLVGRASVIWLSWRMGEWPRWSRIASGIE